MNLPLSIIGVGRAGLALGHALHQKGWAVEACWSRSEARAQAASAWLDASLHWGDDGLSRACRAPVVLLAVVDDAISPMAHALAPLLRADQILLHVSGSVPSSALQVPQMQARCGSLHPLQSLVDPASALARLKGAFAAIEGHPDAVAVARQLGASLGCEVVPIQTDQKAAYHASAVLVSNHLVALFEAGISLMARAGIPRDTARDMLVPLARGTVENVAQSDPARALTGPVRRGDVTTIAAHLDAISDAPRPLQTLYRGGLPLTIDLAEIAGLPDGDALRALLDD